jgi:hypothetical protein
MPGECCQVDDDNNKNDHNTSASPIQSAKIIGYDTINKVNTFKEVYRILKPNGIGRMIISDLVTDKCIGREIVSGRG